jgi:hypothetical protein
VPLGEITASTRMIQPSQVIPISPASAKNGARDRCAFVASPVQLE